MMTIKRYTETGWTLESAKKVSFDLATNVLTMHEVAGGGDKPYDSGHIYVMNENGKTVGVYNLDEQQQEKRHNV